MQTDFILSTLATAADHAAKHGIYPSGDLDAWLTSALKTSDYYARVMWRAVKDAYNGLLTAYDFETIMLNQISSQFRRGYNDGLRELGLSPSDMLPEWEAELQDLMAQELTYVKRLMDDIREAARNEEGYKQFRNRVDMWARRFEEMKSLAMLRAGTLVDKLLTWDLGPTEHCTDCKGYADVGPLPASYWMETERKTGHRPQSRTLECNGYNCQCSFGVYKEEIGMLFAPALNR